MESAATPLHTRSEFAQVSNTWSSTGLYRQILEFGPAMRRGLSNERRPAARGQSEETPLLLWPTWKPSFRAESTDTRYCSSRSSDATLGSPRGQSRGRRRSARPGDRLLETEAARDHQLTVDAKRDQARDHVLGRGLRLSPCALLRDARVGVRVDEVATVREPAHERGDRLEALRLRSGDFQLPPRPRERKLDVRRHEAVERELLRASVLVTLPVVVLGRVSAVPERQVRDPSSLIAVDPRAVDESGGVEYTVAIVVAVRGAVLVLKAVAVLG